MQIRVGLELAEHYAVGAPSLGSAEGGSPTFVPISLFSSNVFRFTFGVCCAKPLPEDLGDQNFAFLPPPPQCEKLGGFLVANSLSDFSRKNGLKFVIPQNFRKVHHIFHGKEIYHLELALGATSRNVCGNAPISSDLLRLLPTCCQNKSEQINQGKPLSAPFFRRRTNVQQLTCNMDLSCSFYSLFFSFVLIELKPFVLKGKVLGEKV